MPTTWTPDELKLFIEEARIDVATQQADKRDIRSRAQIVLTTAIVLGGALVTSYGNKHHVCGLSQVFYVLSAGAICLTVLAASGVVSARSDIGTVSVPALTYYDTGELQHTVAEGYATTRSAGGQTIATLITVVRDCVLATILASGFLAIAHLL